MLPDYNLTLDDIHAVEVIGRGLHSSTSQHNPTDFCLCQTDTTQGIQPEVLTLS